MKRIWLTLRRFFFPPAGRRAGRGSPPTRCWARLTLMVGVGGVYTWDYTNSPEFCGTACHTMPPEYTAYLTSPHARIDCVECHIGRGFIATRVSRKAGDIRHIVSLAFEQYEFPIRADDLRPARDTCERCHFPEKFSDDSLREIQRFLPDEDNTAQTIYLVLKTGGGSARQGLGRGIHWHIENPVSYYASDPEKQQIPYVRVERPDGTLVEYVDVEFGIQSGQRRPGLPGGDGLHHLPQPDHPPGVPPTRQRGRPAFPRRNRPGPPRGPAQGGRGPGGRIRQR